MKSIPVLAMVLIANLLPAQEVLQQYIATGLENNLALKQKEAGYRLSLEVLKEAHGLFYPAVSVNARYSIADGGRVIAFPIGDLLNPVYSTLNQLTASNQFPQVENQEFAFLRPHEQDTKLRLAQPLFNPEIYYNSMIKKELVGYEECSVDQYKRALTAEIKKAYYQVLMMERLLAMLQETRKLLVENVRVNEALVGSGKLTRDNVLRSQTELGKFDRQLLEVVQNKQTAAAYFNFLLNKPLSDSIMVEEPAMMPENPTWNNFSEKALAGREEIRMLENYNNITALHVKMNKAAALPGIFMLVDYGFQGEKYAFNREQDYLQASVVLSWNLFQGFQNRAKINQSLAQKEMAEIQLAEAREKISLEVINAVLALNTSEAGVSEAGSRVRSAREGFRLVQRKYQEGQASLVEFMDARSALTQAEANLIISRFGYLSDIAEFERASTIEIQ